MTPLAAIVALITISSAFLGLIFFCFNLWYRFKKLERQAAYRQEDTAMMFLCLRGCLEGLIESGCNGPVKEALKTLNAYTDNKAAGLNGKGAHNAA